MSRANLRRYLTLFAFHAYAVLLYELGGRKKIELARRFLFILLGATVTVITGILTMSFDGCSVVRDTSDEAGPAVYGTP